MSPQSNLRSSEREDAFSDIPYFTADTNTGYRRVMVSGQNKKLAVKKDKNNKTDEEVFPETGTKIYIGKKITDTQEFSRSQNTKDTTLTDISIDTDFDGKLKKNKKEKAEESRIPKFSETTITSLSCLKMRNIRWTASYHRRRDCGSCASAARECSSSRQKRKVCQSFS